MPERKMSPPKTDPKWHFGICGARFCKNCQRISVQRTGRKLIWYGEVPNASPPPGLVLNPLEVSGGPDLLATKGGRSWLLNPVINCQYNGKKKHIQSTTKRERWSAKTNPWKRSRNVTLPVVRLLQTCLREAEGATCVGVHDPMGQTTDLGFQTASKRHYPHQKGWFAFGKWQIISSHLAILGSF